MFTGLEDSSYMVVFEPKKWLFSGRIYTHDLRSIIEKFRGNTENIQDYLEGNIETIPERRTIQAVQYQVMSSPVRIRRINGRGSVPSAGHGPLLMSLSKRSSLIWSAMR